MYRILVAEDDAAIREELCQLLSANGYQPVDEPPCDLALLDIHMPGENGYTLCRRLRQSSDIPILFLTALGSAEDELLGFAVGADDYIRKPFHPAVLLARIARHLRQRDGAALRARGLELDLTAQTVRFGEESAELTRNEARILACLMRKPLCTREEIIEELWNNSMYIDGNTLYVNINRLREKLKRIGAEGLLSTVRGVGYRL